MIPKFRAWDIFHNKWVKHFYITENGLIYNMEQLHRDLIGAVPIEQSGLIVMQSTGLFDKNGKEIFEGDVIKFNDVWAEYCYEGYVDGCSEGENIVEIVKTKNGWGFGKTKFTDSSIFYFLEEERMTFREIVESNDFNMVVVGNIYENPELVEEGK
ncbi:YopX family protein [Streptococcus suis]|uniref:YopX family protein n=1 Tax=Streptococcus suis TaxID=1307 RepID=UPI001F268923|nr:YopX family protein [Streptococcus suis]MCE6986858.1 YopX family protein [Streptococcus suis]